MRGAFHIWQITFSFYLSLEFLIASLFLSRVLSADISTFTVQSLSVCSKILLSTLELLYQSITCCNNTLRPGLSVARGTTYFYLIRKFVLIEGVQVSIQSSGEKGNKNLIDEMHATGATKTPKIEHFYEIGFLLEAWRLFSIAYSVVCGRWKPSFVDVIAATKHIGKWREPTKLMPSGIEMNKVISYLWRAKAITNHT